MVSNFYKDRTYLSYLVIDHRWSTLLSYKIQIFCAHRISESSKADCYKWQQQQQQKPCSVFKSTLTHPPKWLPEYISWRVNLIVVVEQCSEKRSPGLDVRPLVAKSGPGKQSIYFVLKRKGGILVKSPVFRLFLPFCIQIYNRRQNFWDIVLK